MNIQSQPVSSELNTMRCIAVKSLASSCNASNEFFRSMEKESQPTKDKEPQSTANETIFKSQFLDCQEVGHELFSFVVSKRRRSIHSDQDYPSEFKKARTGWSPAEESTRKERVRVLEQRLRSVPIKTIGSSDESVQSFARAMEQVLHVAKNVRSGENDDETHRTCSTKDSDDTTNFSGIDEGLHALLNALIKRRLRKAEMEQDRRMALQRILGKKKVNELLHFIHEIRLVQLGRAAIGCNGAACRMKVACPIPGSMDHMVDLPQKMPQAVRNIFFNLQLVRTFEQTPASRMHSVDWDLMMKQAKRYLTEYHEWKLSQKQYEVKEKPICVQTEPNNCSSSNDD